MPLPAWAGPAFSLGTSIFGGLFGGRSKPNPLARKTQSTLMRLIDAAYNDDPNARIEEANQAALGYSTELAEGALSNVLGQYSAGGGKLYLPDTARTGAISSAISNIGLNLGQQVYQDRSQSFERWLQNNLSVLSQSQSGKGQNLPTTGGFNLSGGTLASQITELFRTL